MSTTPILPPATWTFVTNHAAVLLCIARDPESRLRDIAERVGITERAAQRIVRDLVDEGYLERRRVGRRNLYTIRPRRHMRHQVVRHHLIGDLLRVLGEGAPEEGQGVEGGE
jgi:DNA-binding MarR family transcriptional regulator